MISFFSRLTESETKTTMNIFADHAGVIINPNAVGFSNRSRILPDTYGIRISPRQSPVYQPVVRLIFIFSNLKFYLFVFILVNLWSNVSCLSISSYTYNMVAIRILNI